MATVELTEPFEPRSLRPGLYIASSLSDAYGSLLASIQAGHAKFEGERIDPDGVKEVAARVGSRRPGRNPAIGISREFFTTVLKDYADWREKWWREAIQNSVDAGATKIDCRIVHNDDATVTVSAEDDGGGMNEDVLINKFLMLGGSTKVLGSGASGGFGKAKELLILPWISWTVHTRDRIVRGEGIEYTVENAPYKDGTQVTVVMPADQTTNAAAAIAIITKCYLPNIRFSVLERKADGTEERHRPKADLQGDEIFDSVPGKVDVYVAKVDYTSHYLYVRVNGLYMFSSWMSALENKQVIAEITAPSIEILTANRDGFRDYDVRRKLDQLTERFSKDVLSALRSKKGLIRKKFSGSGKFKAQRAQSEALSQISYIPPVEHGHTEISARDIEAIATVMEFSFREGQQRASYEPSGSAIMAMPDRDLTTELLSSVSFQGAHHIEEAVKQLAWSPDFFVVNEIEGFKVPAKFMPETMKPQVLRLARTWTELCRYVLMQLGNFRPFGVGWIFSENAAAAFLEEEDEKWLLLNPFKSARLRKDTYTPSNADDLKQLYASAIHECTHLADGVEYHDEAFSTALTNNIAKTADGFRKIRKIVNAIRMKDQVAADYAANPSARGRRLGARISNP